MILVILAAGLGSRYGGTKQLDIVGNDNETIIDFSIYDAIKCGFKKIIFVVRRDILEEVKERFASKLSNKIIVEYVCQEINDIPQEFRNTTRTKPWGTAHALLTTKKFVNENFCVINADDFYGSDAFFKMAKFLKTAKLTSYNFSMIGYLIENTLSENGTVSRGECIIDANFYLDKVYERTSIFKKRDKIVSIENDKEIEIKNNTMVSMNIWGFTPQVFKEIEVQFYQFLRENYQTEKKEFYLPTVVNNLIIEKKASVKVLETNTNWMGVTYKEDKKTVVAKILKLKKESIYPKKLWS